MHFLSQPFRIILNWCQLFCTYYDDFKVGFHSQAPFKAVLEFPLGQMWDKKENKKQQLSDMPGSVQRQRPRLLSLHLPGDLQG